MQKRHNLNALAVELMCHKLTHWFNDFSTDQFYGFVQDCGIYSVLALEIPQPCTKLWSLSCNRWLRAATTQKWSFEVEVFAVQEWVIIWCNLWCQKSTAPEDGMLCTKSWYLCHYYILMWLAVASDVSPYPRHGLRLLHVLAIILRPNGMADIFVYNLLTERFWFKFYL